MSSPTDGIPEYPRLRPVEAVPATIQGQDVLCLRDPMHYSDMVVSVPPQTAAILELFDGAHSLQDIQEAIGRRFGMLLAREQLMEVVRSLDECLLLESPRFAGHREAMERDFRQTPQRPARLAGKSYPAEPDALRRELDGYFGAAEGPGDTLPSPAAARLRGLVVPHIDFPRGGPCYAWGYRELAGSPPADRYIILGTVHVPIAQPFALTRKDFETPLGPAEADQEFLEALLARVGPGYLKDEFAHRGEHSIEFQAVFLRHVIPAGRPVRIVPVLCGSFHQQVEARCAPAPCGQMETFLGALRDTMAAVGGRTVIVASADLAHVGPQFGDPRPLTPGGSASSTRRIAGCSRPRRPATPRASSGPWQQTATAGTSAVCPPSMRRYGSWAATRAGSSGTASGRIRTARSRLPRSPGTRQMAGVASHEP